MKNLITINDNIVTKINVRSKSHYLTEKNTLLLLQDKYIDYCNVNYYPFPKIILYNDNELLLKLSFCGSSIDNLSFINVCDKEIYIENILLNIKNNNLNYIDLQERNICIKNEKIYLIDFEKVNFNKPFNYISNSHHFNFIIDKKTGEIGPTG